VSDLDGFTDQEVLDLIGLIGAKGLPLEPEDAHDLSLAFQEVRLRELKMDETMLSRWVGVIRPGHDQPGLDAIGASLCNDSQAVREALRAVLQSPPPAKRKPTGRILAAQALARLGDTGSADQIADLLSEAPCDVDVLEFGHVTVALEMLGEPTVASRLQGMLAGATDRQIYWLVRAIGRLTGHNPPLPDIDWKAEPDAFSVAYRQSWMQLDLSSPPQPRVAWVLSSDTVADIVVTDGRGVFALEPDDPAWESSWPEWDFSWRHDHQPVYETGNSCSTCDIVLDRVGWAPDEAIRLAQAVRERVADVSSLDSALLTAMEPMLVGLASGRYQLRLLNVPFRPAKWADTWFGDQDMRYLSIDVSDADQEQVFYQLPHEGHPRPFVVAPTQPPDRIDQARVDAFVASIRSGHRPAAIVAAYSSERQSWDAEVPCRSVTGFVLDGHHKLVAYSALDQPARVILICDREPRQSAGTNDPLSIFDELLDTTAD